jgi:tRNA threonylcarbamoyladenosine biosynthesis protein TsaE
MAKNAAVRSSGNRSMASMELSLADSSKTEALGVALARSFPGREEGAVLHLQGELGAGKTTCVRSLLRTLGVTGLVRSPTYTLVDTYRLADLSCAHIDLFRLRGANDVEELGLRDLAGPGSLLLIEWPEKGGVAVPPADVSLCFRYADNAREVSITAHSPLGQVWLENLGLDSSLVAYVSNLT